MKLIVPPALPVTLAEAKRHLRVSHDDDDALITSMIEASTSYLDGWGGILGRALEPQTVQIALDAFPAGEIELPLGPAVSVVSVAYTDTTGAPQVVDPADYELDAFSMSGWIIPSAPWPAAMAAINAVKITWVAGTGCPAAVRAAILLHVGHLYANREAVGEAQTELPLAFNALVAPSRRLFV